jgi:RNA polymerase sigma-70 factor (ECF subfamily)
MTLTSARQPLTGIGPSPDDAEQPHALSDHRLRAAFERHFSLVWRSLRRFGVPAATADDVAQQVFLTFSERLSDVELGRERAFLLSVSVRAAANERRRLQRARETPTEDAALDAVPDTRTPEELLHRKRQRERLDHALATLPDDQRVIFVLFELEGLTLPEIADSLGIPLGTATSRLRRARGRFETWVADQHEGTEP